MLRKQVQDVATSDLAKYDFFVERIGELEAQKVETRLRPEESKLRGLQQTLASFEGTLDELHRVSEHRHKLTHKAEACFDLLGKKHKQRKVDEQRVKEQQACLAERAQRDRTQKLLTRLEEQRSIVLDLRKKIRELDAVRQAEVDFVDRLFRADGLFVDAQHDALEEAVCSLAPRLFKTREAVATQAIVHAKLDSAAHQLESAAEELDHSFEPAHRVLKDKFGDDLGEVFFDSADRTAKMNALRTADMLVKAALHNVLKAKQRMAVLPGLQPGDIQSLVTQLHPMLREGVDFGDMEVRKMIRDIINSLYVAKNQAEYATQSVATEATKAQRDLQHLEAVLYSAKSQLDVHRRSLLSQVQEAKRSNSLRLSDARSSSGAATTLRADLQERWARRLGSGQGMGEKVPSVNSALSRLG